MFIISVLSVGAGDVDAATGAEEVCEVVVELMGGLLVAAASEDVKWTVISAGPSWFAVRFTVIGMAGL